ncbi:MAG: transposase [Chloroflexi bacterium]|nr:transposase [Chloroflexota bacterium]
MRGVCIDMKASFKEVVREVLPQAQVVVDPFHLIADASRRLDETRRL